jgi:hypothetical protein
MVLFVKISYVSILQHEWRLCLLTSLGGGNSSSFIMLTYSVCLCVDSQLASRAPSILLPSTFMWCHVLFAPLYPDMKLVLFLLPRPIPFPHLWNLGS